MKKLFICIILIFISFSCNEKTKLNKNKNNKNVSHEETILQIEDDSFSMKDYINTIQSVNENGGIAIYDSGVFYEVPNEFKVESVKIFGIPGEYYPPENPITQIQIQPVYDPIEWDRLHIQIPIEIYEKYPNQYLEAEHEGKIFFYSNKDSLKYIETKNNENELLENIDETLEKLTILKALNVVLKDALTLLTEKERRVIELYYYEELTLKEISSILEVSESRISQLHTRALQKMKDKMGKYMGIFS